MSWKTIIVHADLSRHAPARIACAVALARAHGAHLIGAAATGVSALVYPAEQGTFPGGLLDAYFGALRDQLHAALDAFERLAAPAGVSFEKRLLIDAAGDGLAALARCADLVVISQDDPRESLAYADQRLPDYLIMNAPRPVLVVPLSATGDTNSAAPEDTAAHSETAKRAPAAFERILVSWNGSRQAAAAVAAALPHLQLAADVVIAAFREGAVQQVSTAAGAGPGEGDIAEATDLLAWLRRHGVVARFEARPEPVDMGHAVIDLAAELDCKLIVAGCFGHSRLRELCLGGVSRTLLRASPIPLLMAHM